jgi:hypothetical protein
VRAHIVLAALQTQNRFALCHLAFKSIRKLHKPSTRIQDTTNDVLQRIAGAESQQIETVNMNPIDNEREQSAIESQAGALSAEPPVEAVDPGDANVTFPGKSTKSQSEPSAPNV